MDHHHFSSSSLFQSFVIFDYKEHVVQRYISSQCFYCVHFLFWMQDGKKISQRYKTVHVFISRRASLYAHTHSLTFVSSFKDELTEKMIMHTEIGLVQNSILNFRIFDQTPSLSLSSSHLLMHWKSHDIDEKNHPK